MIALTALLIFLAIAALTWAVAIALYNTFVGGPDLRQHRDFWPSSAFAVGFVTVASTIPFPGGYLVSLGIWTVTVKCFLELSWPRATALVVILAVLSFLSRLAILG